MKNITLGVLNRFIIHFVGNKSNGEGVKFSNTQIDFENVEENLIELINNSFKSDELYKFCFVPNLDLNPLYQFVCSVFQNLESFVDQSQNAARYLYEKSTHPLIKDGELCFVYLKDCILNDEKLDAIGIFKSENKDVFMQIDQLSEGFKIDSKRGINVNKLEKGCLIFNKEKENGFIISVVDNANKGSEARYWKDEFLSVKIINNNYNHTKEFMNIAKNFVANQLNEDFEVSKADKIDFLNRSVHYFKTNETFDKLDFEKQVFADENVIESFRTFDEAYRKSNELELKDSFDISAQAVKKQAKVFKSILKLDKNFHVYIHGDRNLIEQGIEPDGRKYYKLYFREEE